MKFGLENWYAVHQTSTSASEGRTAMYKNVSRAVGLIFLAASLPLPGVRAQLVQSTSTKEHRPPYLAIDERALFGSDITARDVELRRILRSPDQFAPLVFATVSAALYVAGRKDEARTWYFRGRVRLVVDVDFAKEEFGVGLGDFPEIYGMMASGFDQTFSKFVGDGKGEVNDRAIDEALVWDAATPRNYPLGWALSHAMEAYAGASLDGKLKPGWEARLADARQSFKVSIAKVRKMAMDAAAAEDARAAAAHAGIAAQEAVIPSSDPLDPGFAAIAKPLRTIDTGGCVAFDGEPMDSEGASLFVRCPDIRTVDLKTGAVKQDWAVSELKTAIGCPNPAEEWPPSETTRWPAELAHKAVASGDAAVAVLACDSALHTLASGPPNAVRLPFAISSDGSPFAPLVVDARAIRVDLSGGQFFPSAMLSADGRLLLLTGMVVANKEILGVLVDLEHRRAVRTFRPSEAPIKALRGPYSAGSFVLLGDPPAVVSLSTRPGPPGAHPWNRADSVLIWRLDESIVRGVDFDETIDVLATGGASGLLHDRGPISITTQGCQLNCGAANNAADGFRSAQIFPHESKVSTDPKTGIVGVPGVPMYWLDPRDLWFGPDGAAQARYETESGPIHCEVRGDRVQLGRRWATKPFAARVFANSGPVWCAMNDKAHRLIVGVGRYAHVYALGP